jgi:hypothetical protein
VVFTQIAAAGRLDAVGAHISAEDNWKADRLSKRDLWGTGGTVRSVLDGFGEEYRHVPVIEIEEDVHAGELLRLCAPTQGFGSEAEFIEMWRRVAAAAQSISA